MRTFSLRRPFIPFFLSLYLAMFLAAASVSGGGVPNTIPTPASTSGDAQNMLKLGAIGGSVGSLAAHDGFMYVSEDGGLSVYDVTYPAELRPVGKTGPLPCNVTPTFFADDYAYITCWSEGLHILNISDRSNPYLAGSLDTPGHAGQVIVAGNLAYVADNERGLRIIDVGDPARPTEVGYYDPPESVTNIGLYADTVYIADNKNGFFIIDASDPTQPYLAGTYETGWPVYALRVSGAYAYLANDHACMSVVDLSDPVHPVYAGSYICDRIGETIRVSGSYVYLFTTPYPRAPGPPDYWWYVLDISDPPNVRHAGSLAYGRFDIEAVDNNYAFIVPDPGGALRIVDITDSNKIVGSLKGPGVPRDIAVAGDFAYTASGPDGLGVVDIANPGTPIFHRFENTVGNALRITINENTAFVTLRHKAVGNDELQLYDLSVAGEPRLLGEYDLLNDSEDTVVAGEYVYVADTKFGAEDTRVQIIDVSDPYHPRLAGSLDTPGVALAVAIDGDYAYIADYGEGVRIVDIADPQKPREIGLVDALKNIHALVIEGHKMFAAGAGGLHILGLADPDHPREIGYFETPDTQLRVAVDGTLVYLASESRLRVIDASQPDSLQEVGSYQTYARTGDLLVWDGRLFYAGADGELAIFRYMGGFLPTYLPVVGGR